MKLEDLITETNRELFNRVNKVYVIEIVCDDKNTWSSKIVEGKAIISFCNTKYPESCFAHELLHIDTQIKGYKKLRVGISSFDSTGYFKELMGAFDNELQHHKMFPEFNKMGYLAEQFYIDSDSNTETYLRKNLSSKSIDFKKAFLLYLTLIAPGGTLTSDIKEELKELYKLHSEGVFRPFFNHLDLQFSEWVESKDYNAEPYLKEIFGFIKEAKLTWFGYGKVEEFPNNGFFVGETFVIKQPS